MLDISIHVDLVDRFIERDISAPDFDKPFLQAMKSERRILGDPVYPILQELFEDADAYVERAELELNRKILMMNNCSRARFARDMR